MSAEGAVKKHINFSLSMHPVWHKKMDLITASGDGGQREEGNLLPNVELLNYLNVCYAFFKVN